MANNTVKFNVGGRLFEVSRELIDKYPDTVLGTLVADTWKEDPEETVFIDRNGDTFAHVLDFMRYGSIDLPVTIAKSMFDRELGFYGINFQEGAINEESLTQVSNTFHLFKSKHDMFLLALEAYYQYCTKKIATSPSVYVDISHQSHKLFKTGSLVEEEKALFDEYLEQYFGLKTPDGSTPSRCGSFTVYPK